MAYESNDSTTVGEFRLMYGVQIGTARSRSSRRVKTLRMHGQTQHTLTPQHLRTLLQHPTLMTPTMTVTVATAINKIMEFKLETKRK